MFVCTMLCTKLNLYITSIRCACDSQCNLFVVQVLLAQITGQAKFVEAVQSFCDFSIEEQTRTPKGLVYIEKFGTLCHAANIAFLCLQVTETWLIRRRILLQNSQRAFFWGRGAAWIVFIPPKKAQFQDFQSQEANLIWRVLKSTSHSCPDEFAYKSIL